MESYKSNRPESKSLFTAVMTLSVAWYFISIIPLSAQERVDIDTHGIVTIIQSRIIIRTCFPKTVIWNCTWKTAY